MLYTISLHTKNIEKQIHQEELWIEKAQENIQHFDKIYEHFFEPVYLFLFNRLPSKEDAEELTSTVFAKALLKIKKYKRKGIPFGAWLFRIARNELAQHYRNKKQERTFIVNYTHLEILSSEVLDIDNLFENKTSQTQRIKSALKKLNPQEIEYINLRFFENRSFKEIGHILNITEVNARVKTYRIIHKIKKQIS